MSKPPSSTGESTHQNTPQLVDMSDIMDINDHSDHPGGPGMPDKDEDTTHTDTDDTNNTDDTNDTDDTALPSNTPDINAATEFNPPNEDIQTALKGVKETRGRKGKKVQPFDDDRPVALPVPPYRKFKSDAIHSAQTTKVMWAWSNSMPVWVKERSVWYVYRDWPVLVGIDPEQAKKDSQYGYIDKVALSGELPFKDDADLLNRYGCGSYKVVLNVGGAGALLEGWIVNIGGGRLRDFPPTDERVNNPKQVEWSNPANKSYEQFLRGIGKHPDNINQVEKEGEVAQIRAIETLTDKVVSMAERMAEGNRNAPQVDPAESLNTTIDVIRKIREEVREEAADSRGQGQVVTAAPAIDPIELVKSLMSLVKEMMPQAAVTGDKALQEELKELRRQVADMQIAQLTALQEEVRTLRNNPTTASADPIETYIKFRNLVRDEVEKENPVDDAVKETANDLAPKWLRPYVPVISVLAQGFMQSMLPKGAAPVPMANPSPTPFPQQQAALPAAQQPMHQPQNAAAQPSQQANPQTNQPQATSDPAQQINAFISLMAPGMDNHLASGKSGVEFADAFMDWFSDQAYDDLMGMGFNEASIKDALFGHNSLGPKLRTYPVEQVDKFIHEFMNYDSLTGGSGPVPVNNTPPPAA